MSSEGSRTPTHPPTRQPLLSAASRAGAEHVPRHRHLQDTAAPGAGLQPRLARRALPPIVPGRLCRSKVALRSAPCSGRAGRAGGGYKGPSAGVGTHNGTPGDPRPGLGRTTGTPGGGGAVPAACPTTCCCGTQPTRPGPARGSAGSDARVRRRERLAPCASPSSPAPGGAAASRPPPPADRPRPPLEKGMTSSLCPRSPRRSPGPPATPTGMGGSRPHPLGGAAPVGRPERAPGPAARPHPCPTPHYVIPPTAPSSPVLAGERLPRGAPGPGSGFAAASACEGRRRTIAAPARCGGRGCASRRGGRGGRAAGQLLR
ncbi:unnamed protein product [Coccothraustes coccothraustes]